MHSSFFDTEFDRTANRGTNIWNIYQFSSTYVFDFAVQIYRKYISESFFTDERTRKITSVVNSNPSELPQGVHKVVYILS